MKRCPNCHVRNLNSASECCSCGEKIEDVEIGVEIKQTQSTGSNPVKCTDSKKCPFCAEKIKFDAIKCKHCGEYLDGRRNESQKYDNNYIYEQNRRNNNKILRYIGGSVLALGLIILISGFAMNTSVEVPRTSFMGHTIGGERVANLDLMHRRQTRIHTGIAFMAFGLIIIVTGEIVNKRQ